MLHFVVMDTSDQPIRYPQLPPKAQRAVRIIYITMAIFILLPFLLVWLTGAMRP